MRLCVGLYAGIIGLAILASATSEATELGRQPDTGIRATLSLLPAQPGSERVASFSAFDLKAIRSYLDLDWPDEGPQSEDAAWRAAIAQMMTHVTPAPRPLAPWYMGDLYEHYAEFGLNQAAFGAVAETPVFGRGQISVLVGDGLAEASRLTAALGPGTPVGDTGTAVYWNALDAGRDDLLSSDRLLAFFPDIVIAQPDDLDLSAFESVAAGNAPSLVDEPIVDALLAAIDGVTDDDETLVALFAEHPATIRMALGMRSDDWPASAPLPAYDLVAFGLRFGADTMTSMIVLMYQNEMTAGAALDEMRARLGYASSEIDMPVDGAVRVETTTGWHAVIVSSDMPASALGQQGATTAYNEWATSLLHLLDMRLVGPSRPDF